MRRKGAIWWRGEEERERGLFGGGGGGLFACHPTAADGDDSSADRTRNDA